MGPAEMRIVLRLHLALIALVVAVGGCHRGFDAAFTRQIEAQRLAADIRVQLHHSAEALQRAIMADTDERSAEFVREAQQASEALEADLRSIEAIVAAIGASEEVRSVQEVATAFGAVQDLDRSLVALAVEHTNGKAQRLAFGPARAAADALRDHLDRAAQLAPAPKALRAELLAA